VGASFVTNVEDSERELSGGSLRQPSSHALTPASSFHAVTHNVRSVTRCWPVRSGASYSGTEVSGRPSRLRIVPADRIEAVNVAGC